MNYWAGTALELAQNYPASDSNDTHGYIRVSRNNEVIGIHRWIWQEIYGHIPSGWEVDHINSERTDNRLKNLRCIPKPAQRRNAAKRSDDMSGVQGAFDQACTARKQMEKDYGYHPNHGR